jgi:citrate/tricarballylate utilization protein
VKQLEELTREAVGLGAHSPQESPIAFVGKGGRIDLPTTAAEGEVARVLEICNACRYCEGFCAVFPAMTRRLEFGKADINYLANLCHNCGACLHACQYSDPHEFDVNVPRSMAKVRVQTYTDYAWPPALGVLYQRNGLTLSLATAAMLALFLALTISITGSLFGAPSAGNFYAIFPHNTLAWMFGVVFLFVVVALGIGVTKFWRNISPGDASAAAAGEAIHNVLRLKYLDGGHGKGCNDADDKFSLWRRRFHHFTFYGFLLCFAATSVATLYHYLLNYEAPYPFFSAPVLLGSAGGLGLLIGPAGLLWLNLQRAPAHGDTEQRPMDRGFIMLLFVVALSGLLLLAFRDSSALGLLLAVHLGCVMAFFLTMPYGKFAHGIYRSAALLKWSIEKRQPNPLQLGAD